MRRAVVEVDAQRVSPLGNGWGGDIITLPKLDRSTQTPVDTQWALNFHLSIWQLHNEAHKVNIETLANEWISFHTHLGFVLFGVENSCHPVI